MSRILFPRPYLSASCPPAVLGRSRSCRGSDHSADGSLLNTLGLSEQTIAGDDHAACQLVGGAAEYVKAGGLFVPSARRRDGSNLVIFTNNQAPLFEFEIESKELISVST